MSNNDISRFLFQPAKHYTGMRMQQGRVLLDSDYNEGESHADEDQRRALLDLIGPQGSPDPTGFLIGTIYAAGPGGATVINLYNNASVLRLKPGDTLGFTPVEFNGTSANVPNYFIGAGTMYVGGMRVELERTEFIAWQADYLQASPGNMPDMGSAVASSSSSSSGPGYFVHVFYLHVWEQWISAVEDDEFLEHALGGPDTSLRVRRMRRVEFSPGEAGMTCADALDGVLLTKFGALGTFHPETGELVSSGLLQITFTGNQAEDTCAPCDPSTTGRYLGAENQAIRIMLTTGITYVWAIDDAAPLYRASLTNVDSGAGNVTVKLLSMPKDEEHWPQTGRVVQILPWSAVLPNGETVADEIGVCDGTAVFCTVATPYVPEDGTFTLNTSNGDAAARLAALIHKWDTAFETVHPDIDGTLAGPDVPSEPRLFYVRFWHQTDGANSEDIEISTNRGTPLGTTGLVPNFLSPGLPGDYWIAAVRPETPDRVIPEKLTSNQGAPPQGPRHFYAPLAVVSGTSTGTEQSNPTLTIESISDCRHLMVPVTDMGCCTFIVGDGVNSFGQYGSIQEAIDALPAWGGHVCVRPGVYHGEIMITKPNVKLTGCGALTILESPAAPSPAGLLAVQGAQNLTLQSFKVRASGQSGLSLLYGSHCSLSDLILEAVVPMDSTISDEAPLVLMTACHFVVIESTNISAAHRSALLVTASGGNVAEDTVVLRSSTFTGADPETVASEPTAALVSIIGSILHVENCQLTAYGQVGLQQANGVLEMTRVLIRSASFSEDVPAKSSLDIENTSSMLVTDCSFSMSCFFGSDLVSSEHAVVVVRANGLMEGNRIEANFSSNDVCWGGIQIRGGSSDLTLRGNTISGGAGHGITLGSVVWSDPYGYGSTRREGAGKVLMQSNGTVTGDLRSGFTPEDTNVTFLAHSEGTLTRLSIVDNTIERMGTNGISVLTLFGISDDIGEAYINLEGSCRIRGNRIRDNLRGAGNTVALADNVELPMGGAMNLAGTLSNLIPLRVGLLPYAGIVLGGENTLPQSLPLHVEIEDNIIEDNGTSAATIPISGLVVLAGTSIAIAGNRIAQNGATTADADVLLPGLRAGIAVLYAGARVASSGAIGYLVSAGTEDFHFPYSYSLHVSANRVEQSEGRALYAVGTGPFAIENNFFSSRGFNGATSSDAERFALGDVVYVHNLGRPWESSNTTAPTNYTLPYKEVEYLSNVLDAYNGQPRNMRFVGLGGHTSFSDNHVVYDWSIQQNNTNNTAVPLSYAPVVLASLDHVAARSNQFALRLQNLSGLQFVPPIPPGDTYGGRPLMSHVLAVGHTVDITGNRIAEGLGDCEVSLALWSYAMFNALDNILTHCPVVFAGTAEARSNFNNNTVLVVPTEGGCGIMSSATTDAVYDLGRYLIENWHSS